MLLSLQVAVPLVFVGSLAQSSLQSIVPDYLLHGLFVGTFCFFCVEEVGAVFVDDVAALGALQNLGGFLHCSLALDDHFSAVRLEDGRRSRVCTFLH